MFGISEIAILLLVVTVLFGARKLPELTRSLGKSARILKSETTAMKSDRTTTTTGEAFPRIIQADPGDVTGSRATIQPTKDTTGQ